MPRGRPKKQEKPVEEPLLTCPFLGSDLKIEELPTGLNGTTMYRARGEFWTTRLYGEKQMLLHDLSYRNGRAPDFPRVLRLVQSVREVERPQSDPTAGLGGEVDSDAVERVLTAIGSKQ